MVIDSPRGELFCSNCGFVMKEKIVEAGPEWRSFSSEEKDNRSRTGSPTSIAMHDMGLATVIGGVNKDASGKSLSGSMKSTVERLRTWDRRSQVHESADRNRRQAFSELRAFSDKLDSLRSRHGKGRLHLQKGTREGSCEREVHHIHHSSIALRRLQGHGGSKNLERRGSSEQCQEEGPCEVLQALAQGDGHQDASGRAIKVRIQDSI